MSALAIENEGIATPRSHSHLGRGAGAGAIVVSEFPLNKHQSFRAEIIVRDGKSIVSLSRWKNTPEGARRTGQTFEFGAHRSAGVAKLLRDVQDVLKATGVDGGEA